MTGPIRTEEELTKADKALAELIFQRYARAVNILSFGMMIVGMGMLAVLYWMDVPVGIGIFFGLFTLGIIAIANFAFRAMMRSIRTDIDGYTKYVLAGMISDKGVMDEQSQEGKSRRIGVVKMTGDGYVVLNGERVVVSRPILQKAEIGQKVRIHFLPQSQVAFHIEPNWI